MRSTWQIPLPVKHALRKLGEDIRDARLRRRISTAIMSERVSINRVTLHKIEKGEFSVSMGSYATVLFVLGMIGRLADLADVKNDSIGLALDGERLPKRIRSRGQKTTRQK